MGGRAKRRRKRWHDITLRRDDVASLPCGHLEATFRAETLDEQQRSIEFTLATGNRIRVWDFQRKEPFEEILILRGGTFRKPLVFLDNHAEIRPDYSIRDQLGSIRDIRLDAEHWVGRAFFSEATERGREGWQLAREGHVQHGSLGYRALESVDIPAGSYRIIDGVRYDAGQMRLRITLRWLAFEFSLTPIAADPDAQVRGATDLSNSETLTMNATLRAFLTQNGLAADASEQAAWDFFDGLNGTIRSDAIYIHNINPQGRERIDEIPAASGEGGQSRPGMARSAAGGSGGRATLEPATIRSSVDLESIRNQARDDERNRVRRLNEMAGGDVPADIVTRAINEGWDDGRAGREFLASVREQRGEAVGSNGQATERAPAGHSRSRERDLNVRGLAAQVAELAGLDPVGLTMRGVVGENNAPVTISEQDADRGRHYLVRNSFDFLREALRVEGIREPRDENEFYRAAFSTLAVNAIFTTSAYARLVMGYENAPDTTDWAQSDEVANFMVHDDITIGKAGSPKLLERGGVAQHATFDAKTEQFKALRYALQLRIAEEDIIDDRLGAILSTGTQELAETFAEMRPDLVYSAVLENPSLVQTGNAVFGGSGHNNTTTAALTRSALEAAEVAMAKQRINGRVVNNRPAYLVLGTDLKHTALSLLGSENIYIKGNTDGEQGNLNTVRAMGLQLRSDGRLTTAGVWDPKNGVQRTGSATNWWLFSNRRTLKVVYRRGTGRRPTMRSYVLSQGQWGIGWDINLDIGVAFSDYVGCFRGNT